MRLGLLVILAALPTVHASATVACVAPCGYITPLIDLDFPDKPKCRADGADVASCIPLPAANESVTFPGTVRWYWRESDDLTYPPDPSQPIVISFGGSARNPKWLTFDVQPPSYTIDAAALFDPRNSRTTEENGVPVVWYWFERPIEVTFTRVADPTSEDVEALAHKGGAQNVYVKATSTRSGQFFEQSFGGEQFRFNATQFLAVEAPEAKATPSASMPLLLLVLLAALRRYSKRT